MLKTFTTLRTRVVADDRGATAVDYGLLVALLVAVVVAVVTMLGHRVNTTMSCFNAGAALQRQASDAVRSGSMVV